ncbi:MAG: ROK family protein [Candidatus Eisenbacteria bacterium]
MNQPGRFRRFVVGADLGATHCRAGLFSMEGEIGNRIERRHSREPSGPEDKEPFFRILDELLSGEPRHRLLAIGVGSFGPLDRDRSTIEEAPNRPGWRKTPLRDLLKERYGVPVFLENDANTATYGEYRRGVGRGASSLLGITLGTGVGGGFVKDGEILVGAHGMAAEIGHIYVGGEGIRCGCGALDCLEAYASAEGIKRTYVRRVPEAQEMSCHGIFHLARDGDAEASEVIAESARILGLGIASIVKVLDPERVFVSGGLSRERDLLVEPAEATARDNLFESQRKGFRLHPADLGTDAGLWGAAELAKESIESV